VLQTLGEKALVYRADVFKYVNNCKAQYDIIFADPPFDHSHIATLPEHILSHKILKNNGMLIVEHPVSVNFSKVNGFVETRKYGKVNFSFFSNPVSE
jgi:16S rRNA G966 N2-methylase RsmD